jgi:hypothetical protein
MLWKSSPVPGFQQPLKRAHDNIADRVSRGLVVDSPDIIARRLPDGRIQLRLNPNLKAKETAGAPSAFNCDMPITISFAGLSFCAGCFDLAADYGAGFNFKYAISGINDASIAPSSIAPCVWSSSLGHCAATPYAASDCSGSPSAGDSENDGSVIIGLQDGIWTVHLFNFGSQAEVIAFSGTSEGTISPVTVANQFATCQELANINDYLLGVYGPPDFPNKYSVAYGGTATISW